MRLRRLLKIHCLITLMVKFINNLSLKMAKVMGIHTDKNHAELSNSN